MFSEFRHELPHFSMNNPPVDRGALEIIDIELIWSIDQTMSVCVADDTDKNGYINSKVFVTRVLIHLTVMPKDRGVRRTNPLFLGFQLQLWGFAQILTFNIFQNVFHITSRNKRGSFPEVMVFQALPNLGVSLEVGIGSMSLESALSHGQAAIDHMKSMLGR